MDKLPYEILGQIVENLNLAESIKLRACNHKLRNTASVPTLGFTLYRESTVIFGRRLRNSHRIKLKSQEFNDASFLFLADNRHCFELNRLLNAEPLKCVLISRNARQTVFDGLSTRGFNGELICALLLSNNVDILGEGGCIDASANDNRAIRQAASLGHLKCIRMLMEDVNVNPSARNNEAVRNAVLQGHEGAAKLLMRDSRVDL